MKYLIQFNFKLICILFLQILAPATAQQISPLISKEGQTNPPWRFVGFPKSKANIPATLFEVAEIQGQKAIKVSTQASYGTWVHELPLVSAGQLEWRWRLEQGLTGGKVIPDILTKAGDDAALKVCVMFEHSLDNVPFVERTILRVARSVSGENLPAATICYIWDGVHEAGLQGANPYTKRVRFITLQGKGAPVGQWKTESRNVAADFAQLFADELPKNSSNNIPKIKAVLIGADSDNTGSISLGWVNNIRLN